MHRTARHTAWPRLPKLPARERVQRAKRNRGRWKKRGNRSEPFADALVLDQQVSGEKAKKELGWAPRAGSVLDDLKTGSYSH